MGMLEKRSARILAIVLTLIMVGSVMVYMFRGPFKPSARTIRFDMGSGLKDWLRWIPNSTEYMIFYNYTATNETLLHLIYNSTLKNVDPYAISLVRPPLSEVKEMLVSPSLYLMDYNRSKVYFAYQEKRNVDGYDVLIGKYYNRYYALVDETHPVIYGDPNSVFSVLNVIVNHGNGSVMAKYGKYLDRIKGSFDFAILVTGETAKSTVTSNGTPMADFYFEGYRMNGSMFEKVVGIHFLGNYFFVHSNKTTYYYCKNYNDSFSIAIMDDYNLTKLINTTPEIRAIIIKMSK